MTQVMIELTVVFDNQSIPNKVLLTGPFDEPPAGHTADISRATAELRKQAEVDLGADLKDEQCFYRLFHK